MAAIKDHFNALLAASNRYDRGDPNHNMHRAVALLQEEASLQMVRDVVGRDVSELVETPTWWTDYPESFVRLMRDKLEMGPAGSSPELNRSQSLILLWATQMKRGVGPSTTWICPTESLVLSLASTKLKGLFGSDVKMPYPAFNVELPPGLFYLSRPGSDKHEVRMLSVVEGYAQSGEGRSAERSGRHLLVEAYGLPRVGASRRFNDIWVFHRYRLPSDDERVELEEVAQYELANKIGFGTQGLFGERVLGEEEIHHFLLHFVINLLVFMVNKERPVHAHAETIKHLLGGQKRKNLRKSKLDQLVRLENDPTFTVGTTVKITPELRAAVLSGKNVGSTLTYRTLVRGHWRNQACGEKWASRRLLWIEPHVRGADLPTPVVAHTYKVGSPANNSNPQER